MATTSANKPNLSTQNPTKKIKRELTFNNPNQMVTLYATKGPLATPFIIHKEFACHYSPVFNAAFNSNFIEGQTQEYRFDEKDDAVIKLLVQWIYTQKLEPIQLQDLSTRKQLSDESVDEEDKNLVKLWMLADELMIPQLQNLVIRKIDDVKEKCKCSPYSCFNYIYEKTSEKSVLRLYFIHMVVAFCSPDSFKDHFQQFPHQMLIDILQIYADEEARELDLNKFFVDVP